MSLDQVSFRSLKTNIRKYKKEAFPKRKSSSNPQFSGVILVSERVLETSKFGDRFFRTSCIKNDDLAFVPGHLGGNCATLRLTTMCDQSEDVQRDIEKKTDEILIVIPQ